VRLADHDEDAGREIAAARTGNPSVDHSPIENHPIPQSARPR